MTRKFLLIFLFAAVCIVSQEGCAQSSCIWLEQSVHGTVTGKIAVSADLVKALAKPGSEFDLDGTHVTYDTLLYAYNEGKVLNISDSASGGESSIYGGSFGRSITKSTTDRHYVVVESTDSSGVTSVHKVRVESFEAAAVILAMIKSSSIDESLDSVESILKPGGVLYIENPKDGSSIWIYVN